METNSQSDSNGESNGEYEFINTVEQVAGDDGRPPGAPIPIVKVTEDRHFELDLDALSDILLRDSIRDKPVVVVSIAGDFRKGMSCALIEWLLSNVLLFLCPNNREVLYVELLLTIPAVGLWDDQ